MRRADDVAQRCDLFVFFYHATQYVHVESILQKGLLPCGLRSVGQHVHMTPYHPDECGRLRAGATAVTELSSVAVHCMRWVTAAIVAWHASHGTH